MDQTVVAVRARFHAYFSAFFTLFFACIITLPATAAGPGPEVARGMLWLQAQVQPDGALSDEGRSLALPLQSRSETLHTLGQLGAPASVLAPLQTAIAADSENNTEFLARRALVLGLRGMPQPALIDQLQQTQNSSDGGYGGASWYASHALDTAFVLRAQRASPGYSPVAVSDALAFLLATKNTDGAYTTDGQRSLYATSHALLAASAWPEQPGAAAIGFAGQQWLLTQRNAELHFGNAADNALALWALLGHTAQADVLQPLVTALKAEQLGDGSWNGDPYVTALALRALYLAEQPSPPAATGSVSGQVVSSGGTGLANVTVQIVGTAQVTTTDGNGYFAFPGAPTGTLTIRLAVSGHGGRDVAINLVAGQTVNLGTVALAPAVLTSSISGVIMNSSGQPLSDATVVAGTALAVTNASGTYVLSDLSPGDVSIGVTRSGYVTMAVPITLVAGTNYVFSPRLVSGGSNPPTTTSLTGKLVDASTQKALAGATVQLGSGTTFSAADGAFSFTGITPGAFSMTVAASGYRGAVFSGVTVKGVNAVGTISLEPLPAASSLSGLVTDAVSGLPIGGASVRVEGQGLPVLSDADGKYLLGGLSGANFILRVSADGYLARAENVALAQVGNAVVNLALQSQAVSGSDVSFLKAQTINDTYPASGVIPLEMVLANNAGTPAAVRVFALVLNADDSVVFEYQVNPVTGWAGATVGLTPVTIGANSMVDLTVDWNALRLPQGQYRIKARAIDADGRMVAQADSEFNVIAGAMLAGAVTADPPLAQAGARTQISLTGDLTNSGNTTLAAGDLQLRIVLDKVDASESQQARTEGRVLLTGAPMRRAQKLTADKQGNLYTFNNDDLKVLRITPGGAQQLVAMLPPGSNPADITLDLDGNLLVANESTPKIYKITQLGVVTTLPAGLINNKLSAIDMAADGTLYLAGRNSAGEFRLVRRSTDGVDSVLWGHGLSNPYAMVKDAQGNFVVTNLKDGTLVRLNPATRVITPFVSGLKAPKGITIDAAGNLYVVNSGDNTIVKVNPAGQSSVLASGLSSPTEIQIGPDGNLYVSNTGDNAVVKVTLSGQTSVFAKGVAYLPRQLRYDAAGLLWITNGDGTVRTLDARDQTKVVATGLNEPRGIAFAGNGDVLITEPGANTVKRLRDGVVTPFAAALASPYGIALDAAGTIYVGEQGAPRISRFDIDGNKLGAMESLLDAPQTVRAGANGDLFVKNTDFISHLKNGVLSVVQRKFSYTHWVPDTDKGSFVVASGSSVLRIAADGTPSTIRSALGFSPSAIGLIADGTIVLLDSSNKKVHQIDAGGNLSLYATLPSTINSGEMRTDQKGNVFVRLQVGGLHRVLPVGDPVAIPFGSTESVHGWSAGANGELLVWGASKTYRIDPMTNSTTLWVPNVGANAGTRSVSGAGIDGAGQLVIADDTENALFAYDRNGAEGVNQFGFAGVTDIIWTGAGLRFVDAKQHLFDFDGSNYPTRKKGRMPAAYLTQLGTDTLGTSNGGSVYRWTGLGASGHDTYMTASGANSGIAQRPDGGLALAENTEGRVRLYNAAKVLVKDFAGLRSPQGLAFDALGRLFVANYNGHTVARFDSLEQSTAITAVHTTYPQTLAFDSANRLLVGKSNSLYRAETNGTLTELIDSTPLTGVLVDGAAVYGVHSTAGRVLKLVSTDGANAWESVAAGLSDPMALRTHSRGGVFLLNVGNNTVVDYVDGALKLVGTVPAGMRALTLGADQSISVAGTNGNGKRFGANGHESNLLLSGMTNGLEISGLHQAGGGKLYALSNATASPYPGILYEVDVIEPQTPPAVGSTVYETSMPMPVMEANGTYAHFDFGKWIAPYGGDFKIELSRAGVPGIATNFVHVGPHAQGVLSVASSIVPLGDSELGMCVALKGADSSAISRVEFGQVREISGSTTPEGMASDKQGNLYITDSTSFMRTNKNGAPVVIVKGLAPGKGLATADGENFYLTSKNATTTRMELLRLQLDGTKTVVADLNVTTANGLQLDSKGDILVGTKGKLLRVTQQGVISVVTTTGIPDPLGLAIDANDAVYVQNTNHVITKISAEAKVSTVFAAVRPADPIFEGDGYPTIAADCGENFYMAPYDWKRVNQSGEEHTLVQVVPRTGGVSTLFDTQKVHQSLSDIDYLEFDRLNSRLLMWNHGSNKIWQVPISCGSIGAQAHLIAQPGQTLSGASKAPTATVALADGRTEYMWNLRDVSAQGTQVCFNASQRGVVLGEERKAIDSAFLSFQNTFAAGDVTVPLDVPRVRAGNLISVNVNTDAPVYPANTNAVVGTTLSNANNTEVSGALQVQVLDRQGVVVATVVEHGVTLPAGGALPVIAPYNTGTSSAGDYTVVAQLIGANGTLARAETAFKVQEGGAGKLAHASVASERQLYQPNERVTLLSRVSSDTTSTTLEKLAVTLQVFDPANALVFEHVESIGQLMPGGSRDFSVAQPLRTLAPGAYSIKLVLRDANGTQLDAQQAGYKVASSADSGAGLSGNVQVAPKTVHIGESLALMLAVTNRGNSVLPNLPVTLSIVDPVEQKVVVEFPYTYSFDVGATFNTAANWLAQGVSGRTYLALLAAKVGAKQVPLAQDSFNLLSTPTKLDIRQSIAGGARVLVLVSCAEGEIEIDAAGHAGACVTQRTQTIAAALTAAKVSYTIATDATAFKRELRSGRYNIYWVSGKQDKLHGALAGELREAAYGGAGLIMDSEHDQRNKTLDQATGVRWSGKIGELNLPVSVSGAAFPPAQLRSAGRGLKMGLTSGIAEARFAGSKPNSSGPAMVSNVFGAGRALVYGFDLAASLRSQAGWQANLEAGLNQVAPVQPDSFGPGSVVPVNTRITNLAQAHIVAVQSVLPPGSVYLGSEPAGIYDAGPSTVSWSFPLAEAAERDLRLNFQLGEAGVAEALNTVVSTVRDGVATPYGEPLRLLLNSVPGGEPGPLAHAQLSSLVVSSNREVQLKARMLGRLDSALLQLEGTTRAGHEQAIGELVSVIDDLSGLNSADTGAVRMTLGRLLRDAEWRWSQLPPEAP